MTVSKFNSLIDQKIKNIYSKPDRIKGDIATIAYENNISKRSIYKRAKLLGCNNSNNTINWSEAEIKLIQKNINKSINFIHNVFIKNKYKRSKLAIKNKINEIRKLARLETYTANILSLCFGVSSDTVEKWIKNNYLEAEKIGNLFSIQSKNVKKFIQNFPNKFDITKVDQTWFLDIIFDGKLFKNKD